MSAPTMTGYPRADAWFFVRPALPGDVPLHRAWGYHVDAEERELHVDADCGLSFTATTAVLVPSPGPLDSRCGRCLHGRPPHRSRRDEARI